MFDWIDAPLLELLEGYLLGAGFGLGILLLIYGVGRANSAWHRFRLKRRLARDPEIFLDEYREYRLATGGEDGPPIEKGKMLPAIGGMALPVIAGIVGLYYGGTWEMALVIGLPIFLLLLGVWRKLNDPPSREPVMEDPVQYAGPPHVEVPPDAVAGFAAAMVTLAVLALFIWLLA